jgi:CheY-like chemotaxis protein
LTPPEAPTSTKDQALLAGRKLLLADDSITIQKVVDLTFADEGVQVVSFGNGREAVEKLEAIAPDIVLADVFMPEMNGYEVCEYIKQHDNLKHIPVMLLVGSFEPFDEAEARRVGADEILTKPFQSIRRLIDKVGGLVSGQKPEEALTAELPKPHQPAAEPELLSTEEIAITTADTQRLPDDLRSLAHATAMSQNSAHHVTPKHADKQTMDNSTKHQMPATSAESADALLDLGDIGNVDDAIGQEFVLDVEMSETEQEPVSAVSSVHEASGRGWGHASDYSEVTPYREVSYQTDDPLTRNHQFANTQEFANQVVPPYERVNDEAREFGRAGASGKITLDQLAPEVIEAIARRAVEMLSEKAVQEIAWEVVPELSEIMIKRQLEEKNR